MKVFNFNIYILTILFILFSILINQFQLIGMTDNGFYISVLYNLINFQSVEISIYGGLNFLSNHFTPILFLIAPFAYFFDPVEIDFLLLYIGYFAWLMVSYYLFRKIFSNLNYINTVLFFIFFILLTPVFFNFYLNYNGLHMVLFATPFLSLSYYYLLVKSEYRKSFLYFIPTLLIKEEYWLIFIFFNFTLFLVSKEKKYIFYTLLSIVGFYLLYFKLMKYLYVGDTTGMLSGHYSYLFEASTIKEIIQVILELGHIDRRIVLLISFFVPFSFIINLKKITKKDLVIFIFIIGPTFGYSFLSKQTPMSYWLIEHYSLPVLPMMLAFILKYPYFTKIRLFSYMFINVLFIVTVIYLKQPWQYKYYQDEKQLYEKIFPILDLKNSDFLLSEDRTGIYFSQYQVDYIQNKNFRNNINKKANYFIFNTRYSYLAQNVQYNTRTVEKSSYEYIASIVSNVDNYGIIYFNYPFVVYERGIPSFLSLSEERLNEWDKKTIGVNHW